MFKSARIKLTAWYLLIIMAISISFSTFIYYGATMELDRVLRAQRFRIEHPSLRQPVQLNLLRRDGQGLSPRIEDPEVINEAKLRVLIALIGVNAIILFLSSLLGYILAGKTLLPIQEIVDEQNRFITDASHELRTPLTSLRTALEVNLRNRNLSHADSKKLLQSNLEDVIKLQSLAGNLMELSQYQYNGLIKEDVSLSEIVGNAIKKVQTLAKDKNIIINNKTTNLRFLGNKESLSELFVILLDNAIKYSSKNKEVLVLSQNNEHAIIVTVKDQGIGISKEDLPNIFKRFFRAEKSRSKDKVNGYGLGLSIAKKIVQIHNGKIEVVSTLGKGSAFSVILPKKT